MTKHITIPLSSFDGCFYTEVLNSFIKIDVENKMFYSKKEFYSLEWDEQEGEDKSMAKETYRCLEWVVDMASIRGCRVAYSETDKTWILNVDFSGLPTLTWDIGKEEPARKVHRTLCREFWPLRFGDVF